MALRVASAGARALRCPAPAWAWRPPWAALALRSASSAPADAAGGEEASASAPRKAPSPALGGPPMSADGGVSLALVLLGLGGAAASYFSAPLVLGKAMESYIETVDRDVVGVDIEIGALRIYPLSGVMHYKHFRVMNPSGFKQDSVVSADKVIIDCDISKLWRSGGKHVDITTIKFENMRFHLEYSEVYDGKSNFEVIRGLTEEANRGRAVGKPEERPATAWKFHKVVLTKPSIVYGPPECERSFRLKDLSYADYDSEVGSSALDDCVHWVLSSVIGEVMNAMAHFSFSQWLGDL